MKSSLPSRAQRATLPTREHIAVMLDRLETIDLAKWLAVERLLVDVLAHAEEEHRRRFHRPNAVMRRCLIVLVLLSHIACAEGPGPAPSPTPPPPAPATYTLFGAIRHQAGRVAGATVEITDGADRGTTTQSAEDGSYRLAALTPGTFGLRVTRDGYAEARQRVALTTDTALDVFVTRPIFSAAGELVLTLLPDHRYRFTGTIRNDGDACGESVHGTFRLDVRGQPVFASPWALPATQRVAPSGTATYSVCCLADQVLTEDGLYYLTFQYAAMAC